MKKYEKMVNEVETDERTPSILTRTRDWTAEEIRAEQVFYELLKGVSAAQLKAWSKDANDTVRAHVAMSENTPLNVIASMKKDSNESIRSIVEYELKKRGYEV